MAIPNAKPGYEPGEVEDRQLPKFHMAVDSEYKVRNRLVLRPAKHVQLKSHSPESWTGRSLVLDSDVSATGAAP